MHLVHQRNSDLCQCYAPLPPAQTVRAIVGQGGDLKINCPTIWDIPYSQIPLQKMGDYWGFDTCSVTMQHMENITTFETSLEVIKFPTRGDSLF